MSTTVDTDHTSSQVSLKEHKLPIRSWKKKYRKMRIKFQEVMDSCNDLVFREKHAISIAKRLGSQNDLIREILLDLNESSHFPDKFRLPLNSPETDLKYYNLTFDNSIDISDTLNKESFDTTLDDSTFFSDISDASQSDKLTTYLPDSTAPYSSRFSLNLLAKRKPASSDQRLTDTDAALRNPVSVINWLRRYQPEMLTSDKHVVSKPVFVPKPGLFRNKTTPLSAPSASLESRQSNPSNLRGSHKSSNGPSSTGVSKLPSIPNQSDHSKLFLAKPDLYTSNSATPTKRKRDPDDLCSVTSKYSRKNSPSSTSSELTATSAE